MGYKNLNNVNCSRNNLLDKGGIDMSEKIYYINDKEQANFVAPYVHIYGVRSLDGQLDVAVYSDSSVVELSVNGRLLCRQKNNSGAFDFQLDIPDGEAVIRASSREQPNVYDEVSTFISE